MVARAWNLLVLLCSVGNAIWIVADWHNGDPADWFVWVSAILFYACVALNCLGELAEPS